MEAKLRPRRMVSTLGKEMNLRSLTLVTLATLGTFMLSSCSPAQKHKDVSSEKEYESYISTEYVLEKEMHLSGVNSPPEYGNEIDYYMLSTMNPGWDGPEVISRESIKPRNKIKIESIEECTNCLFGLSKLKRAKIRIFDYKTEFDLPIYLSFDVLADSSQMKELKPNQSSHTTPASAPR